MTTSQKAAIFKAISASVPEADAQSIEQQAAQLLQSSSRLRPQLSHNNLVEVFHARINSDKIAGSIETINHLEELPSAVAEYVSTRQLPTDIAVQPSQTLLDLNWQNFNVSQRANSDEQIAVTMGDCGIAETGSIVINSAPDSPLLINFLPSHHILVIFEKHIVANLEDYADAACLNNQRTVCLITGASGTTDIEGVLVNGAHGPEHLHIVSVKQST